MFYTKISLGIIGSMSDFYALLSIALKLMHELVLTKNAQLIQSNGCYRKNFLAIAKYY